ncbi:MAG: type IV secretory system conjugative DNA transfer family protein, partial [Bacteroidetes bacterium]|nr:type IV secretory system conjugative DNA transfer family protein [Bacteroidota bacterium]
VLPNLYTLANEECSVVVTDTSGELYAESSGYLANKGFDIKVLNLMDTSASEGYNPLASVTTFADVSQVAHVLIRSALPDNRGDPFWSFGAERLIRIVVQCLKNRDIPEQLKNQKSQ